MTIKLYSWRPTQWSGTNLGDEIGPPIVEAISGRTVEAAGLDTCNMISVGSILQLAVNQRIFRTRVTPIHVWGSGIIGPQKLSLRASNYIYHAVRGPLTRMATHTAPGIALGDPGLFAADRFPASQTKSYAWGIVPHHSQRTSPAIRRLLESTPNSILIDVTNPDITQSLKLLASCERIASTSLHGLVFADSYGIPNAWLYFGPLHHGGTWKFLDYLGSLDRTAAKPAQLPSDFNLHNLPEADIVRTSPDKIRSIKEALAASFPAAFRA